MTDIRRARQFPWKPSCRFNSFYDHESYAAALGAQQVKSDPRAAHAVPPETGEKQKNVARVFLQEEQVKLESYIKQNMNLSTFGIYLCLYTGFLAGELCSLRLV